MFCQRISRIVLVQNKLCFVSKFQDSTRRIVNTPRYRNPAFSRLAQLQPWHISERGNPNGYPIWLARLSNRSSSKVHATADGDTSVYLGSGAAIKRALDDLKVDLDAAQKVVDMDAARARLRDFENQAEAPDLWESPAQAQQLMRNLSDTRDEIEGMERMQSMLEDGYVAVEFIDEDVEGDEMLAEAADLSRSLRAELDKWEARRLLGGRFDSYGAVLVITAGAGGLDAMDWAGMLERMYTRWGSQQGFKVKALERSTADENLTKSVSLEIEGRCAYGYLCGEKGAHRLVRQSPFNAKASRETSFAAVEVMPLLEEEDNTEVEIPDSELEISTMRSGGAGGQNVNKVETGVRIKHLPTGLAVKCTEERSQLLNKERALKRLKSKLLSILEEQRAETLADIRGDMVKADFGQQIRNYVFHPYTKVKDVRTGAETSDVSSVMDGDLQDFIIAFLRYRSSSDE